MAVHGSLDLPESVIAMARYFDVNDGVLRQVRIRQSPLTKCYIVTGYRDGERFSRVQYRPDEGSRAYKEFARVVAEEFASDLAAIERAEQEEED